MKKALNGKVAATLLALAALVVATAAICEATTVVSTWLGAPLASQPSLDAMLSLRGADLAYGIVVVAVLCPVVEEMLFRGLLFALPAARLRRYAAFAVAAASSALFSFAHYIDYAAIARSGAFATNRPDNAFLALFVFGLVQCRLYRRTRAIWCPMLSHSLFNAVNLALLFAFPELARA